MNTVFLGILLQISMQSSAVTPDDATADKDFCQCVKVMVVPADDASREAADAFSQNLSASVFPAAPLGDVSGLGDEEIALKARNYDVDTLVIVRAIPKKLGSKTLYSRLDVATSKWTLLQKETTLDPSLAFSASAQGLHDSVAAADLAQTTEGQSLKRGEFHRNRIVFGPTPWTFSRGVLDDPITETEFYRTIGRKDLAEAHESLSSKKTGLLVGGGVTTALGVGLSFVGLLGGGLDGEMPQVAIGVGGAAAILVGAAGIVWGASVDPHPVSESEAHKLGEAHNDKLAQEMGVR